MATFQITTCPSCKQEFEEEIDPLPCLIITGYEDKKECPFCNAFFDENDPALKFRFRKDPRPIKSNALQRIKKLLHWR